MSLFMATLILAAAPVERKTSDHAFEAGSYVLSIQFLREEKLVENTLNVVVTVQKEHVKICVERGQILVEGVLAGNKFESTKTDKATILLSGELLDHNVIEGKSIGTLGANPTQGTFTLKKRSAVR